MIKPFGNILGKAAGKGDVFLETAEGWSFRIKRGSLARIGLLFLGIPHMGLRLRAHYLLPLLSKRFKRSSSLRVLDDGCGFGLYCLEMANRNFQGIVGIDVDIDRVKASNQAAANLGLSCDFLVADAEHLPFKEASFQLVLSTEVIEHLHDDEGAIKEISRVLSENGSLCLSTPGGSDLSEHVEHSMGHERSGYEQDSLSALLENQGLMVDSVRLYASIFGSLSWRANRFFLARLPISIPFLLSSFYPLLMMALLDRWAQMIIPNPKNYFGWVVSATKK